MYGTNVLTTGLTLSKVLSGISRGLTIANQILPIYQQAKPMISNARKIMGVLKEFNTPTLTNNKTIIEGNSTIKKTVTNNAISNSNPVFFQ